MKGISIIVCCYNSAKRLEATLTHIAAQKITALINCELVLVNNLSTDDTEAAAEQIWLTLNSPFMLRIVNEQNPGLSNARKRGVTEAMFDYLIFCDDDNWLEAHFISTSFAIMDSDERIGILGGKIAAVYEKEPEPWLLEQSEYLAIGPLQEIADGDITNHYGIVFGAGMVLRKKLFADLNELSYRFLLSDRKGNLLTSCGDTELCFCARLLGYKIFFSNQLHLHHFIPVQRMTVAYFKRLMFGLGYSSIHLLPYIYALQQTKIKGIEKFKITWYWQALSTIKAMIVLKFASLGSSQQLQLQYAQKKGRLKALLTIRSAYQLSFKQVAILNEK